jgi:diguanylate cyclase (GGDEF)-like protein
VNEAVAVLTTLALLAIVLSVSARSMEPTPLAKSWSLAFALAGAAWTLNIVHGLTGFGGSFSIAAVSALAMAVPVLLWKGLAERAGQTPPGRGWFVALALVDGIILFAALRHDDGLWAALSQFFRAVVLVGALGHVALPNRRARVDEQMMRLLLALLAAISLIVGVLALARQFETALTLGDLDRWLLLLALPPVFTGIGIAALTLIANDLAADLRRLAATDPLTGILNRRGFDRMCKQVMPVIARRDIIGAFMLADLDRFKTINDQYGHEAGDQVLVAFARAIEGGLRPGDLFGRTGGEEFAILLVGATTEVAISVVERLRAAVRQVRVDAVRDLRLTASFGMAPVGSVEDLAAAQRAADRALYAAKEGGRDRAVLAEADA